MIASRLATAAVIALGLTGTAFAADLPEIVFEEPVPLPEPSRFDWSGFYAGINGGVIAGSVDPNIVGEKPMYENAGVYGGHIGVSASLAPMFVVGVEADLNGSTFDQSRVYPNGVINSEIDWTSSVRGRFGVAFDQFVDMPGLAGIQAYATGGVAFARMRAASALASDKATHTGWTVGGGVEAALTDNLSLRAEYLYTSYAKELYDLGPSVGTAVPIEARTNVVRAGLSYYF